MATLREKIMAGRLTISRYSGGDDPRNVKISCIDDISGVEFVSIAVTPEEFALAITGQGHISCSYTVRGLKIIGKKAENKTEIVPYEGKSANRKADMQALAAMEVDGWKARRDDLTNPHCWADKGYRTIFFRHTGKGLLDE